MRKKYYTPERLAALVPLPLRLRWGARIRENLKAARHTARLRGIPLEEQLAFMAARQRKGARLTPADLERALSLASPDAREFWRKRPPERLARQLNLRIHAGATLDEAALRLHAGPGRNSLALSPEERARRYEERKARKRAEYSALREERLAIRALGASPAVRARLHAKRRPPEAPGIHRAAPAVAPLQRAAVSRYRNCGTCKHAGLARCNRFPSLRADPAKVCTAYHFDGAHYGIPIAQ